MSGPRVIAILVQCGAAAAFFTDTVRAHSASGDKPAVLRAAEDARSAATLVTSRVEYSRWRRPFRDDRPDHVHYYTFECAGDEYVTRYWGDEEGVVRRGPGGAPATYTYSGPRHMLRDETGDWIHAEGDPSVDVWEPDTRRPDFGHFDLRRISLNPGANDKTLDEARQKAGLPPIEYTTTTDGDLDVVSSAHEGWTVKWWIDRKKNFSVVKMQTYHGDALLGEVVCQPEEIDGVWVTTRQERYGYGSGVRELLEVVQVHRAEFNRPEHPQRLTPEHIGVEVGTSVDFQRQGERSGYWDGGKIVPADEFFRRLHSGELARGPTVQKALDNAPRVTPELLQALSAAEREANRPAAVAASEQAALPKPAVELQRQTDSDWARYTRKFIADYSLDREQSQKAWGILRDCQEQAARYLKRERQAFEKLDGAAPEAAVGSPTSAPTEIALGRKLREPIDKIFEAELQPRLERLPTRAQRQRAPQTK